MHYVYATCCYSTIGCIFCSASFDTKAIVDHNISWRIFDRPLQKKTTAGCCLCKSEPIKQPQQRFARKILEVVGAVPAGDKWCGVISWSKTVSRGIMEIAKTVSGNCFFIDIWELLSLFCRSWIWFCLNFESANICEPIQEEQKEFDLAYKLS